MKKLLATASILLVTGGALVGCGSDDTSDDAKGGTSSSPSASTSDGTSASSDASSSASSEEGSDFCQAFLDFGTALSSVDPSASPSTIIKQVKSEADKLGDVDLPSDITDDAKDGFNAIIGAIDSLPDDATLEDLGNLENGLSAKEKTDAQAFNTYLEGACPELSGDSGSASSAPSANSVAPSPSASQ
jgi:hypothetical protein